MSKSSVDSVTDEPLAAKTARLCALVIAMEGKAVPPDDYTSNLIVDPDNLKEAAGLAYAIRQSLQGRI
jgi:hypothetical protein